PVVTYREQYALDQMAPVGGGVDDLAVLQLYLMQALDRRLGDRGNRHGKLQSLQTLRDVLPGIGPDGGGAEAQQTRRQIFQSHDRSLQQTQKDSRAYHETVISPTGMMTGMQLAQPVPGHMGVDLRGRQITVPQQHLHHPQI